MTACEYNGAFGLCDLDLCVLLLLAFEQVLVFLSVRVILHTAVNAGTSAPRFEPLSWFRGVTGLSLRLANSGAFMYSCFYHYDSTCLEILGSSAIGAASSPTTCRFSSLGALRQRLHHSPHLRILFTSCTAPTSTPTSFHRNSGTS